ncbi:efflux RND transporter periplasmic adaptor subunit [Psychrobacter pygoscelis]|uniref:efflux RND transporter periplasmic adaptor subunit n=1 Tax=Psychrobacter pygoscelis TaxID=2488563 RepID=UPI00103FE7C4|nr:efflux RND transporter periplasmic adaptor subunit [Psychrobacter pygoscelis]
MRKLSKKSAIKWALITLILVALAALAYSKFKPKEEAPNYITATATIGDIENNVMASGKVKALNTVDVGAQVSGEVTKLFVGVGDEVKKGDLIAQIDQVTQKNNLSNQQASLAQSEAALQSAKAEFGSRQASLNSAYADLARRQVALKQARNDFARLKPLIAIDAISQQEYDSAATKVESAEADVINAQAAIDNAKAALITAQSNITREQAALQKSQTDLNTAAENLGYTTIRAPIDGTIVSVTTEQGATVNSNQSAPTIVTIADLSTVRINAQISEADIINVRAGMPVYFNTIGNPDQKYDAVLTAIEPAPEKISTTSSTDSAIYYVGYIEVPNPDKRFRIDMTAQVFIVIDQAKGVLLVPSAAVQSGAMSPASSQATANKNLDQKTTNNKTVNNTSNNNAANSAAINSQNRYVRVLKADGSVEERAVKVGIDNRVNVQILSGLQAGEVVILGEESTSGEGRHGEPS